jgi:hypothetical protein
MHHKMLNPTTTNKTELQKKRHNYNSFTSQDHNQNTSQNAISQKVVFQNAFHHP